MLTGAGGIIFDNLPIIFALGVAIGLAGGDGVAAIAAFVGFIILNKTMGAFLHVTPDKLSDPTNGYANVLGIPTLQTGVFGGIIIGALAAWCYNKFYNITLPSYLGFFAGKRFCTNYDGNNIFHFSLSNGNYLANDSKRFKCI